MNQTTHPSPPDIGCHEDDWDNLSRLVGLKLDTQTQQFVCRLLQPEDAARSTYDNNGPEELLRLGAPSSYDIHFNYIWEPMIRHYGLQVLNAAGFINGQPPPEYLSGFVPQGKLHMGHQGSPIHPVLRRDMWIGLTDDEWGLIYPGLQLATALLDEPEVLRFYGSYFLRWTVAHSATLGHDIKVLQVPKKMPGEEIVALYRRMADMVNYTSFEFVDDSLMNINGDPCSGITSPGDGDGMIPGETITSKITMTRIFLDILRQHQNENEWDELLNGYQLWHKADDDRKIHIDGDSSKLRTLFSFVQTILHELNHAVAFAAIPVDFAHPNIEPWFPGDVIDECGYAFDKFIWNGRPDAHTADVFDMEMNLVAPYGMQIYPDWTTGMQHLHGNKWQLPVPASWFGSLVSKRFWEDDMRRYGGAKLRCPLVWEWAIKTNPVP